jgi:hypothetical protein
MSLQSACAMGMSLVNSPTTSVVSDLSTCIFFMLQVNKRKDALVCLYSMICYW